ncbi:MULTISPECIES: fimbrial biogenesis chaperone [Ralstonia]|uniref:Gram-negative pili assembly chaperone, N-terminal domain protein n=1 Tax=Ralstonia insidiosa TaxID=190721 RepID=A0AAC9FSN3_9RALS|nr:MULTISPECIES: molecular chaperone [Ralstonia]ANH75269.1 gram-negative pili assembly chaperone, N-terminal domain protein [Ralstonia insidiosa]
MLIAALAPFAAHAAALQISPIRLDLPPGQMAAVIMLHNRGTQPLNAQVRVFRWTQDADGDHLEPATTLVASPPIVQIPASGEQVVRVVLTQPPVAGAGEQAYRLLIDELPDRRPQTLTGVTMQLRYSVPVFVNATADAPPKLTATLRQDGGKAVLVVRNIDRYHAQLSAVSIEWSDGTRNEITPGLLGYALAGATRTWPIADARTTGVVPQRLRAQINGVAVEIPLARAD